MKKHKEKPPVPAHRPNPKRKIPPWTKTLKQAISARRMIQASVGLLLFWAVSQGWLTLTAIILIGSAVGIVLGKIFCRWFCPMGFMMEMMTSAGGEESKAAAMYQYFKVGCPIAWAGGLLNRVSLLKVKISPDACVSCGKCDDACYIAGHNDGRSLHLAGKDNSSAHYACSRCLSCVSACPTGALTFGPAVGSNRLPERPETKHARSA